MHLNTSFRSLKDRILAGRTLPPSDSKANTSSHNMPTAPGGPLNVDALLTADATLIDFETLTINVEPPSEDSESSVTPRASSALDGLSIITEKSIESSSTELNLEETGLAFTGGRHRFPTFIQPTFEEHETYGGPFCEVHPHSISSFDFNVYWNSAPQIFLDGNVTIETEKLLRGVRYQIRVNADYD
ncbi:hypothetical protein GALMADRAFT_146421 [Galerina marginata CBS 339.88]|uniref:Uncharacterized protein n=1 Tax=Galerina marginata (strain CBS 339.88) TaxID=685588 RepID=A0A067SES5_GALM3|nr:hypothetical protein GALMADRAFT_146421 [Galerina marginata CBS 339.88]